MAAAHLVEELTKRALGRYSIMVIGAEPRPAYNRVLLSSLLADELTAADLELRPRSWWKERGVTTVHGQAVASIDRASHSVSLARGLKLPYSKLVLATGSRPIRPACPGIRLPGVFTFRDLGDIEAMRAAIRGGRRAAVIGGGLLGIEAAYGLAKAGAKVTLVHLMDRLMERQLDHQAAALLKQAVESNGVEVLLNAETRRILGADRIEGLELADGQIVPADFAVCAIGVSPNAELARQAGLGVGRGILVDDHLGTSDPDIFAAGECAEHRGAVCGLVEPCYEQARVLARRLAGDSSAAYRGSIAATNLKVSGVNVFSAGAFMGAPGADALVFHDEGAGIYKRLTIEAGKLVGAVLFGDTADAPWYLDLIRSGADVTGLRDVLAFGRALALPLAA
jgi:nitrite reductase (NADH) large subunit